MHAIRDRLTCCFGKCQRNWQFPFGRADGRTDGRTEGRTDGRAVPLPVVRAHDVGGVVAHVNDHLTSFPSSLSLSFPPSAPHRQYPLFFLPEPNNYSYPIDDGQRRLQGPRDQLRTRRLPFFGSSDDLIVVVDGGKEANHAVRRRVGSARQAE